MATISPVVHVFDSDGALLTGQDATLTLNVVTDGVNAAYAGAVTEVATGQYAVTVTVSGRLQSVAGTCSTSGAVVVPACWYNAALLTDGDGAFPVTLYVKAGTTPIQNAKVRINATGGDCTGTTNSAGAVAFNLDAGTYTAYVGTGASYTPSASYTVTVSAAGAVTAPADATLAVTAVALPTPSDPDCYTLYDTETDEQDATFGASAMTITVIGLTADGRVDATNNRFRSIMQRSDTTDASGQWSLDIPIQAFTAGAYITLRRTWTDAASVAQSEDWTAQLAAPASGVSVCWSDLSPYEV